MHRNHLFYRCLHR